MDFEEELKRNILGDSIFKRDGEQKFDRTFIPDKIPHRDDVLRKLASDFKIVFKEDKAVNIALKGEGGFGKTAIARFTQNKLGKVAAELGINLDARYYTCFQYRTLGTMLRDYLPTNYFISGKGFSISELIAFLVQNLQRENKKLLFIIDEIQNLKPDDLMRIISINEEFKLPGDPKEYFSTILIARTGDWEAMFREEPRIAHRLNSTITLPKYTFDQLVDIFTYRRDLALKEGILSDDNVELITQMSELSGNVYYGIELMHHAGKMAEGQHEPEILPEMIRAAAKYVSTEFRDPVLNDLKKHELLALLAISRVLENKSKKNVNYATTEESFDEYKLVCEEMNQDC
nr:AAA family ATPase [Candidatus Sigynarchaeota archaeon]